MTAAQHAAIAVRAYFLWIEEGMTHGRDIHHWTAAEQLVALEALDAAADLAPPAEAARPAGKPATAASKPSRSKASRPAASKPAAAKPAGKPAAAKAAKAPRKSAAKLVSVVALHS